MSERTSFVGLSVGFLLCATGVLASCPIELNPTSVVVRYGDPVSINCSTTEGRATGMGWEASVGGTGVETVRHVAWTVASLTQWDAAPMCFYNPPPDTSPGQCIRIPTVVVYTFPGTVGIHSPGGGMYEGETYPFTCDVPNIAPVKNLTVMWYRGDALIHEDAFENASAGKSPVNQSSVLDFRATRQDDGLTVRCEAHLDLRPNGPQLNASSQEMKITVHFGPEGECLSLDKLDLREGDTLGRRCPVTGRPEPHVSWLKEGQPVDPGAPLSRTDAGLYRVSAEGASLIRRELSVHVLYGPELKCPKTYTAVEYAPRNLSCTGTGHPQPDTIWRKDGEEVKLPETLTRNDSGQYSITASSDLSSVTVTVEIDVLYEPSQIVELKDSEVDVGSAVWLNCSSTGNPQPQYSWDYYATPNVMVKNKDGVSRLHIRNATAYNAGSYTCHASNEEGSVSKTAKVSVKGASTKCPIKIIPERMVVRRQDGDSHRASCSATAEHFAHLQHKYWQDKAGKTNGTHWSADPHGDWSPEPRCIATFNVIGECWKPLDVTFYKTPDGVSIRAEDRSLPAVEGRDFQLRCDVTNVAPAGSVSVRWYRGNETFEPSSRGPLRLTDCQPDNDSNCDPSAVAHPLNVSASIRVTLNRTDSRAEFRCEARLDLGPEGPQPAPTTMSGPLNVTVNYKPVINTTKLPKAVPVFRGYPEVLVCEADGQPPPKIQWRSDKVLNGSKDTLTVSEAGVYNCTATNEVDSTYRVVIVILKEDYLPLIAGFVAVTVVAISIVFLFIYSIYYKNTKMRRYSLKNPKLDTPSSNVAHNGWDMQFPMTKLS
ncbi:intercellular adhesion molecule 5-like [Spinachia spinachia]